MNQVFKNHMEINMTAGSILHSTRKEIEQFYLYPACIYSQSLRIAASLLGLAPLFLKCTINPSMSALGALRRAVLGNSMVCKACS